MVINCDICLADLEDKSEFPRPSNSKGKGKKKFVGVGTNEMSATRCGHLFHTTCLEKWIKKDPSCPKCRRPCPKKKLVPLYPSRNDVETNESPPAFTKICKKPIDMQSTSSPEDSNSSEDFFDTSSSPPQVTTNITKPDRPFAYFLPGSISCPGSGFISAAVARYFSSGSSSTAKPGSSQPQPGPSTSQMANNNPGTSSGSSQAGVRICNKPCSPASGGVEPKKYKELNYADRLRGNYNSLMTVKISLDDQLQVLRAQLESSLLENARLLQLYTSSQQQLEALNLQHQQQQQLPMQGNNAPEPGSAEAAEGEAGSAGPRASGTNSATGGKRRRLPFSESPSRKDGAGKKK